MVTSMRRKLRGNSQDAARTPEATPVKRDVPTAEALEAIGYRWQDEVRGITFHTYGSPRGTVMRDARFQGPSNDVAFTGPVDTIYLEFARRMESRFEQAFDLALSSSTEFTRNTMITRAARMFSHVEAAYDEFHQTLPNIGFAWHLGARYRAYETMCAMIRICERAGSTRTDLSATQRALIVEIRQEASKVAEVNAS